MLNKSYEMLYNGIETSLSVYDMLDAVIKDLRNIQDKVKVAKNIVDSLEEAYFIIEQNINELRSIKDSYYYDADELAEINSRIYEIGRMKKKYGETIESILEYKIKLEEQYEDIINRDEIISRLTKERSSCGNKCREIAEKYTYKTRKSLILEEKNKEQLTDVGMAKVPLRLKWTKMC